MSEKREAPVVPGSDPELVGTGPQGAVKPTDDSVSPEDVAEENPQANAPERGESA